MAYNVLKGTVEGSVDQHGDQEIEGKKVFKNTISASVFYDTDAESPCATMKDVVFTALEGRTKHGIVIHEGNNKARLYPNFKYDGNCLSVNDITANIVRGDASQMTNIPANRFTQPISAEHIKHGPGLANVRNSLQIKAGPGVEAGPKGIGIRTAPASGLSTKSGALTLDPAQCAPIDADGQNLSDQDLLVIKDISREGVRHTTLSNFYDNYVHMKTCRPAGSNSQIQFRGPAGFAASSKLSYNGPQDTLDVEGTVVCHKTRISQELRCEGAIVKNIQRITSADYEVQPTDYTLLCDSLDNAITLMLPAACNNVGRIITIKKINTKKYNLRSFPVVIKTAEGAIDITDQIVLKMNYSVRTLQSDGENWWIIGSKGT